jgi:hypothetical protein
MPPLVAGGEHEGREGPGGPGAGSSPGRPGGASWQRWCRRGRAPASPATRAPRRTRPSPRQGAAAASSASTCGPAVGGGGGRGDTAEMLARKPAPSATTARTWCATQWRLGAETAQRGGASAATAEPGPRPERVQPAATTDGTGRAGGRVHDAPPVREERDVFVRRTRRNASVWRSELCNWRGCDVRVARSHHRGRVPAGRVGLPPAADVRIFSQPPSRLCVATLCSLSSPAST